MRNLYHVTTIRGMPVRIHYTWLVVALLGLPVITHHRDSRLHTRIGGLARLALTLS